MVAKQSAAISQIFFFHHFSISPYSLAPNTHICYTKFTKRTTVLQEVGLMIFVELPPESLGEVSKGGFSIP